MTVYYKYKVVDTLLSIRSVTRNALHTKNCYFVLDYEIT